MTVLMKTVVPSGACTMEELKAHGLPPCGCAKASLAVLEKTTEMSGPGWSCEGGIGFLAYEVDAKCGCKCGAQGAAESPTSISWPQLFSVPAKGSCLSVISRPDMAVVGSWYF